MVGLLWLIPAIPFASAAILVLWGKRLGNRVSAWLGVGSIGLSALIAILVAFDFLAMPGDTAAITQTLWHWFAVGSLQVPMTLYLDPLSLLMVLVVTVVGFLIHLYSASFMSGDEDYSRFFAYMNLFVGFMLLLVLADNLVSLVVGWEGVGLCSYLLIGFWYKDPANGEAARKAFIVTRIGDVALLIALFLLFKSFGTLNIQDLMAAASTNWPVGAAIAGAAAILLLGGAVGKSAQLPLQTWLPDAMAGPTPTSALIHAATMVTAGVYLVARMHVIFDLSPMAQAIVAIVGAATLLLAGLAALGQRDIKRVLAYSTISQIGYMFLALGVGAYSVAMFHFMTHAFFKALLFLCAGVVILAMDHEHDMFKMGGLKKLLPVTFWTFLIGSASLSAVPLITSGSYSKDAILWAAWSSPHGSPWLWLAGIAGALLTSLYTFRMVFITFYGTAGKEVSHRPGMVLRTPLVVLAVLALIGGFVLMPETLGGFQPLGHLLGRVFPALESHTGAGTETLFEIIAAVIALFGIILAYVFFLRQREKLQADQSYPIGPQLSQFFFEGLGFDRLYDRLIVTPYQWISRINRSDFIDLIYTGLSALTVGMSRSFSPMQDGRVRSYAVGISIGAVVITLIAVLL
jgi:NADH-quinone oxidoreductase subunit L